ncbi:MAG: hypothetical protein K8F91_22925 [Candidatus Obscuribacterales bacterium]|nr:hypothetical protein [Candidatus Obscuribacterales bacterium]
MQSNFSPSSSSVPAFAFNGADSPLSGKAEARPEYYGWILHPAIDIFLICGGLIWAFCALMFTVLIPAMNNPTGPFISTITITALIVFTMPHQMATYLRVFNSKPTREKLGKAVLWLGVLCIAMGLLVTCSPYWASLIGRFTLGFSFQHFFAQAYGIGLLYCYKRGFVLNNVEKNTLFWLVQAGIWAAITGIFSHPTLKVGGLTLEPVLAIPLWVRGIFDGLVIALAVVFAVMMAVKWTKTKKTMPLPAVLTLVSCFFFLDYLTRDGSLLAIAILGQALFHTPQYLVVTTAYHLKEVGLPKDVPGSKIWTQLWKPTALKYLAFVLGAGWIMSTVIGPYLPELGALAGFKLELALCGYYCAINIHHYMADGLIWKMRDKDTLKTLLT